MGKGFQARKCGYLEQGIQGRTCGYTELSVRHSYPECTTPNIGTIWSLVLYKILIWLEYCDLERNHSAVLAGNDTFFDKKHSR